MAILDACTMLDEEHNEVLRLFEQYESARDGSTRQLLAQKIGRELGVHMQLEEEIFYPAFRQATGDEALLKDGIEEHDEARALIAKIEENRLDHGLVLELYDAILHHVNDEREKMFPKARSTAGLDLRALAARMQARRSELTEGHPA